ncbi:sodium:solute symporter [Jannaschia sp. Os4]|uniref:ATP-binding protein n=1 Tax=Jannaschia sp. Os4 TaxID=2807617 RepID=UPI00193996CC|nr:ATP-binding protein [Jannaschia sp. Os4]MBM2577612.1 sodium:solute symporter [Jannaschia sp. Os4]
MTLTPNLLVGVCLAYVAALFAIAFYAEGRARRGRPGLRGPLIYTLSLSVYCTAWTFYGAVGYAARSGLEFMTIYLGPTLVLIGWWTLLRKLVRVGRAERVTSIADMISSRFGKSAALGVIVTLLALVGTTPYIALQLQSVTASLAVFAGPEATEARSGALWIAAGLALFTILFGTRRLDVDERHEGIVSAIAVEAVVKLVALLAVGAYVVWGLNGGARAALEAIRVSPVADWTGGPGRWAGLILVSGAAIVCLPRMFHVLVVEAPEERDLATASWAFPLYLLAMCLFVVPIAVTGLRMLPGTNPDLFVLTLPLAGEREGLAMLAFLGGFSSATSMVIVAALALATMLSNHVVMPAWFALRGAGGATISGDVRAVALTARRLAIVAVLGLAWLYYRTTGGTAALASIGLIAFVGLAQVLPALVAALTWKGATRAGAAAGILSGFAIWAWVMLVPVFAGSLVPAGLLAQGPFGVGWLRPEAMFGLAGDPLVVALMLSLGLNATLLCLVSLLTRPTPMEMLQAPRFVDLPVAAPSRDGRAVGPGAQELLVATQRILGADEAQALFAAEARSQGRPGELPATTPALLDRLERRLAGSVGAATAHAMISGLGGGQAVGVEDLIAVADETAQVLETSARLEARTEELRRTTAELREANAALTRLGRQKDAFLGQVSHELRTPMTSIRAFSEILREGGHSEADRARFAGIILDESRRLTRLLDDLLDIGVLESGQVELALEEVTLASVIDRAVTAATSQVDTRLTVTRDPAAEGVALVTDPDRLAQVFINLVANAAKYCDAPAPDLTIRTATRPDGIVVDLIDNGSGIAPADRAVIFQKFARLGDPTAAGGAGLGLAICREVMGRLGGSIDYLAGQGGAAFRLRLPHATPAATELAAE